MKKQFGKIAQVATLGIALAFTFSCSSDDGDGGGDGGKGNDIKNYKTVVIGTQTWMAENLDYNVNGSKCNDNKSANCTKYGRLYNWATAKTVCPTGWHLPSDAEWDKLMRYVDGTSGTVSPYRSPTAGRYLKATSGWNSNGNGTDARNFTALPGGGYSRGRFKSVGNEGYWWSSSAEGSHRSMTYDSEYVFDYVDYDEDGLFSVRCVQD